MEQIAREALTTAEELLLLAIDPRTGALHSRPAFRLPAAVAGAVLVDLFAEGSLTLVDDKVVVGASGDDARYRAVLERIRRSPPHDVPWWVDTFGYAGKEAKGWTIASLVDKGVIAIHTRPWLPPFPRTRYRVLKPAARSAVASKILATLRRDSPPDTQSTALAVIAGECGFVDDLAPRSERRGLTHKVRALLQTETVSSGDALDNEQPRTVIAQVYEAVYAQGFNVGGAGN
jgi:hypothetical protein